MTFSTRPIIDLVKKHFVPVWESVAQVTTATFDLGDGKELKGIVGGEIAIFFCRPDGKVFDILPALQSPAATRLAIEEAIAFYEETKAEPEAVRQYHQQKFVSGIGPGSELTWRDYPHKKHLEYRRNSGDLGTIALGEMIFSKVRVNSKKEPILVVEPGGRDLYAHRLHQRFGETGPLVQPAGWSHYLFEEVLGQNLEGGDYHFDSTSLTPMTVMPN